MRLRESEFARFERGTAATHGSNAWAGFHGARAAALAPLKAAIAAIVFGACDALQLSLQIFGTRVPPQLLLALPYIVTILAISDLFGGKAVQPAALMTPYVKE